MSSRELFISSPRCTCADVNDYVRSLLCATSDVVEWCTVTFETENETETWLKFRDETETSWKTSRPRLEVRDSRPQNLCILPKFIFKMSSSLLTCNFFKFLACFRRVLVVSYMQIRQTKNRWIMEILINHFFAIFKVSRPETFETETETRKNGSRDSITVCHIACWFRSGAVLKCEQFYHSSFF